MSKLAAKTAIKISLMFSTGIVLSGCIGGGGTHRTSAEQEVARTMSASQYQPRTQMEREAVETQDLFAQTAFWSREYDLNPGDLEAAVKLSSSLRKMGNPGQALEIAKTARAMYPRDTALMAEFGASLIAMERGKDAIGPLSSATRLDPRNPRILSLLGAAHDQIGQYAKGREYYGRALGLAPNDSNILANVGLSYALEGDPRTAEIWLRRAAQNPNASAHVRQNLALVLGLQGKYSEAESLAREDLDSDASENNLAYLRSLKGGSRTYEALEGEGQAPNRQMGFTPNQRTSQPSARKIGEARGTSYAPSQRQSAPSTQYAPQAQPQFSRPQYQQRPQTANPTQQPYSQAPKQLSRPTYRAPQPRAMNAMPRAPMPVQTAPNVTPQAGGAMEAARAAAIRMQQNGGAKRTVAYTPAQAQEQKDVLAQIRQSLAGQQQRQTQGTAPQALPYAPSYAPAPTQEQRYYGEPQMRGSAQSRQPARRRN